MNNNSQIISLDNSQIQEIIYPRLETLDTLLSIIPRRIAKNPIDYYKRKSHLQNIAINQEIEEQKIKKLPPFNPSKFLFQGEKDLNNPEKIEKLMLENTETLQVSYKSENSISQLLEINTPVQLSDSIKQQYVIYNQDNIQNSQYDMQDSQFQSKRCQIHRTLIQI
ncbi:hypothetical protein PPERSA_03097 [Pseudocohnilembus persalinus]|uniref:Uncharacterized protein n=1 Tax=Pseudocohnilembus persalinus TaxID=266149 RepID=A0A0V0R920_PSEPJ|nr:hypothetical protein PPERSA_03097 [Pseudocohnilembus persalinus]|eukprot:KRX10880.1 hypothetical protein PPERSA_03097 [Pseudocohnilembus persalinus]